MVPRPGTWRNLNSSGWNRHTTATWGGSWVCGFPTGTVCNTSGKPTRSSRWPPCLHNNGCTGWGTWLECQRPSIPTLRSLRNWRALLLAAASRCSLSGQLFAKTSRQLAYHTRVGSGMCRRGTNHQLVQGMPSTQVWPPHRHAYSRPGHVNVEGGCYLWFGSSVWLAPSSFAWKAIRPMDRTSKGLLLLLLLLMFKTSKNILTFSKYVYCHFLGVKYMLVHRLANNHSNYTIKTELNLLFWHNQVMPYMWINLIVDTWQWLSCLFIMVFGLIYNIYYIVFFCLRKVSNNLAIGISTWKIWFWPK